jgi:HK97 family phage major capsid protein
MQLNSELLKKMANELSGLGIFATAGDVERAISDIKNQMAGKRGAFDNGNEKNKGNGITAMIRGLSAQKGLVINTETRDADISYAQKTLTTGATPGSYLVPTVQADSIIEILGRGGVVRASGATIWPMASIQKLNVPTETMEPTVEYLSQTTAQTPSDPNLGQLSLDLKERRALVALPNNLLRVSVPAVDAIVTRLLGKAFAKSEDLAFFQGIANGPTSVQAAAGITTISQAGASLAYSDLLNCLSQAAAVEAEGPFAWYMHPTVFFTKILGLKDTNGRPIVTGYNGVLNDSESNVGFVAQQAGAAGPVRYTLMGHPVYLTVRIPQHVGSGSATSYILFTNPSYIHIGDSGSIEIAVSGERFFDINQTAIRAVSRHDFGFAPPAGIVMLQNVI